MQRPIASLSLPTQSTTSLTSFHGFVLTNRGSYSICCSIDKDTFGASITKQELARHLVAVEISDRGFPGFSGLGGSK